MCFSKRLRSRWYCAKLIVVFYGTKIEIANIIISLVCKLTHKLINDCILIQLHICKLLHFKIFARILQACMKQQNFPGLQGLFLTSKYSHATRQKISAHCGIFEFSSKYIVFLCSNCRTIVI